LTMDSSRRAIKVSSNRRAWARKGDLHGGEGKAVAGVRIKLSAAGQLFGVDCRKLGIQNNLSISNIKPGPLWRPSFALIRRRADPCRADQPKEKFCVGRPNNGQPSESGDSPVPWNSPLAPSPPSDLLPSVEGTLASEPRPGRQATYQPRWWVSLRARRARMAKD